MTKTKQECMISRQNSDEVFVFIWSSSGKFPMWTTADYLTLSSHEKHPRLLLSAFSLACGLLGLLLVPPFEREFQYHTCLNGHNSLGWTHFFTEGTSVPQGTCKADKMYVAQDMWLLILYSGNGIMNSVLNP